jgi:hypothetical protein
VTESVAPAVLGRRIEREPGGAVRGGAGAMAGAVGAGGGGGGKLMAAAVVA